MNTIQLMINGLPGKVAETIYRHAAHDGRFRLIQSSLTGPDVTAATHRVENTEVELIRPENRSGRIKDLLLKHGPFITVDYTHPSAVNSNVDFYCSHQLPFVMGTTGGDRDGIRKRVLDSDIPAVIAPNMNKQIVGIMAMMEYAAKTFPGLFSGYTMEVKESHQSWKADTSGTAKAMVRYFNHLGVPFTEDEIYKERDPIAQKNVWNIPEKYLDGHGWHTYTLTDKNATSTFGITHNISGRDIYAEGTLDAVLYLHEKIGQNITGHVYSMIDVLKKT
ncbi:MAG: dihydrodipicolinate reductase [Proteobacteria bacterium]|nr:dihydrodipicolinate reductase [Pseudomonadota bacterium]